MLAAPVCFHYYWRHTDIPLKWTVHSNAVCRRYQRRDLDACTAFCGPDGVVEQTAAGRPDGYLHRCPFRCIKVAAPVMAGGINVGMLFTGPFGGRGGDRVSPEQAGCVVSALALKLGLLIHGEEPVAESRKSSILQFCADHCEEPVSVHDLARALALSPSRTAHVLRELFECTFSELLRNTRVAGAARCLRDTDLICAEIAHRFCFYDQSHFTRCFRKSIPLSPMEYRARYRKR